MAQHPPTRDKELGRCEKHWPNIVVLVGPASGDYCHVKLDDRHTCQVRPSRRIELYREDTRHQSIPVCEGHGQLIIDRSDDLTLTTSLNGPATLALNPRGA